MLKNDPSAFYAPELGAAGGLAAQLLFLARERPEEKFQFSFYMVPMPLQLTAWQSMLAHLALDAFMAKDQLLATSVARMAAWGFGWCVYDAWVLHS